MKKNFYIVLALSTLFCSGCSFIGTSQFLVPQKENIEEYAFKKDWDVDIHPEGTFGQLRPYLYKSKFNSELSYIMYPITIEERAWLLGPILLPVIPIWYLPIPKDYRTNEIKIIWIGNRKVAEKVAVTIKHLGKEDIGKLKILSSTSTEVNCSYIFKNKLLERDILYLTLNTPAQKLEIKLKKIKHTCFIPYMNPLYGGGPYAKKSKIKYFQREIAKMNYNLTKRKEKIQQQ